ncbi:MAG: exodeoxyribonuclease III [Rickettsiales bacterium]|jgi:exodeoxyribonuclease-3|nr:exodeoxyribonuclease III [Rickettsiales bacterium]
MIKISTWNVNSINARLDNVLNWLKEDKPDIVLLQELKCTNDKFPSQEIEDLGYNIAVHGQKTYNGVAILSKYPLSDVMTNFENNPVSDEARYIEAIVNFKTCAITVASVYVPNGQDLHSDKYPIKLEFLKQLGEHYKRILNNPETLIVGGDFNIALTDKDIYDPEELDGNILFSDEEKRALRQFMSSGLTDSYRMHHTEEKSNCYTWWDYRANSFNLNNGMRIDYIFTSPEATQINTDCYTSKECRAKEKPSDHIPVTSVFDIS